MQTYDVVQLASRVGIPYPYTQELFQNLDKYRIEAGWITLLIPFSSPESTFYALAIAGHIDYRRYDPVRVSAYLEKFIRPDDAAFDLQAAYFAVRGLALLNQKVDDSTIQKLQSAAISQLQQQSAEESEADLFTFALLAQTLHWDWPAALKDRASEAIRQDATTEPLRIDQIRRLAILQSASGVEIVPREELKTRLLGLWVPEGGFKAVAFAPYADLDSTFQALDALSSLGYNSAVDQDKVRQFVRSCQDEYGFNYVPPALIKQDPQTYTVRATLASTSEGLEMLEAFAP